MYLYHMESYKRYLLDEVDMSEADADLFLTGFYTVSCKKGESEHFDDLHHVMSAKSGLI